MAKYFDEVSQEFSCIDLDEIEGVSRESVNITNTNEIEEEPIQKCLKIIQRILFQINQLLQMMKGIKKFETSVQYCKVYKKTILIRLAQNISLIKLISNQNREVDQEEISKEISTFAVKPSEFINLYMINLVLSAEEEYLLEFGKLIHISIKHFSPSNSEQLKEKIIQMKSIHSKLYTIAQMFPGVCAFPKEDLLNYTHASEQRWERLKDNIKFKCYGSQGTVTKSFQPLKNQIIWANAAMNKLNERSILNMDNTQQILDYVKKGLTVIQMLFLKDEARKQAEKLISEPNQQLTKEIWNMPDKGMAKHMLKIIFPKIAYSHKIYIPRKLKILDLQTLNKLRTQQQFKELIIKQIGELSYAQVGENINQYRSNLFLSGENKICMRINCPESLQYAPKSELTTLDKITTFFKKAPTIFESVMFHIHGGGFISMSSYSHQVYTRKWANQLNIPIISVDYSKAPENPYPQGLADCLQGYLWILNALQQVFDIKVRKIILVGDSAGGNLVAALTNLVIQLKLRKPNAIFLVYPALNLDQKAFSPSLLNTLDDFILPHTYLKICARAYVPKQHKNDILSDYFLSPILTPATILKQYPLTKIYIGNKDPFYDDCLRLTEKLQNVQNHAKLTVFVSFSHGFLQFDNILQPIPQARESIEKICRDIKQILQR